MAASDSRAKLRAVPVRRHPRTNLAPERTSFVGRERELAQIARSFAEGSRLVTLLGGPGTGKTRLARRFGASRVDDDALPGGIWFCDLSEARSRADVAACVAASLEVALSGAATAEAAASQVGHAIAGCGAVLLLLDNFEQVCEHAAGTIGSWLALAPGARFVVTSRERLDIEGEAKVELGPLADADAVALFDERSRLVDVDFRLDAAVESTVAELVRRLDGNPLAIELAAARVDVLPPRKLYERLASRLDLLRSNRRDVGARHATLRSALDWSWDLLGEWERDALAQCSVFRAGFSLEAAEAVLAVPGAPDRSSCLDHLDALRGKSLLRSGEAPGAPGEPRFGLTEIVREYASEKLTASGARAATEARHAAYYLELAEAAIDPVLGADAGHGSPSLDVEIDNLTGVVRRRAADPSAAARAAICLDAILATRGPGPTHLEVLDAALAGGGDDLDPHLRARLLCARAGARRQAGQLPLARADLELALEASRRSGAVALEAIARKGRLEIELDVGAHVAARADADAMLELGRGAGDPRLEGIALHCLGRVELDGGDAGQAELYAEQALALVVTRGPRIVESRIRNLLGIIHRRRGRLADAERHYAAALAIAVDLADRRQEIMLQGNLALLEADRGQHASARARYEIALDLSRRMGYRRSQGIGQCNLGTLEHDAGAFAEARARYDEALVVSLEVGDRRFDALTRLFRGLLDLEEGRPEAADELRRALAAATSVAQHDLATLVLLQLAAAEAARDDVPAAEEALERARVQGTETSPPYFVVLHDLMTATVELAKGRAALRAGRREVAVAHAEEARRRELSAAPAAAESLVVRIERRVVASALARFEGEIAGAASARVLEVGSGARWFRAPGAAQVDLTRRRSLRLLVLALSETRQSEPGRASSLDELLEAGWPGERLARDAGIRRVYTAVGMLRDLGLRDVLIRHDDGYLLDPQAELAFPAD